MDASFFLQSCHCWEVPKPSITSSFISLKACSWFWVQRGCWSNSCHSQLVVVLSCPCFPRISGLTLRHLVHFHRKVVQGSLSFRRNLGLVILLGVNWWLMAQNVDQCTHYWWDQRAPRKLGFTPVVHASAPSNNTQMSAKNEYETCQKILTHILISSDKRS